MKENKSIPVTFCLAVRYKDTCEGFVLPLPWLFPSQMFVLLPKLDHYLSQVLTPSWVGRYRDQLPVAVM